MSVATDSLKLGREVMKMADVKFPDVRVKLVGGDGNAFAVLGSVQYALRKAGVSKDERDLFVKEATGGDYDHLLSVVVRWVKVS